MAWLAWRDDNPARSPAHKLANGLAAYAATYDRPATTLLCHPAEVADFRDAAAERGIAVKGVAYLSVGYFHVGTPVPPPPLAGIAAETAPWDGEGVG